MALHRLTTIALGVPVVAPVTAGNFSEYYADLDCIVDDQSWKPGVWDGYKSLYNWGPPVPPSFLSPDDLAEVMAGAHA
jgi:hypothetical protein